MEVFYGSYVRSIYVLYPRRLLNAKQIYLHYYFVAWLRAFTADDNELLFSIIFNILFFNPVLTLKQNKHYLYGWNQETSIIKKIVKLKDNRYHLKHDTICFLKNIPIKSAFTDFLSKSLDRHHLDCKNPGSLLTSKTDQNLCTMLWGFFVERI